MDTVVLEKYSSTPWKSAVLLLLSIFTIILTVFSLEKGIQTVFTHFYYVPIVLAAYWFQKKGVLYSAVLGVIYLTCVVILTGTDTQNILAATSRVVAFIGIAAVVAVLSVRISAQQEELRQSEQKFHSIWEHIQAGIILVDGNSHEIIAANPEAEKMIGSTEKELIGHTCHKFICPADEGKCPISDQGKTVDRAERVLLNGNGESVPVLKTVTVTTIGGRRIFIENFINITALKDAENALIAYIREATLRIRNPVQLVRDNLSEIRQQATNPDVKSEHISTMIAIQEKHMEGIMNNLSELEQAITEKRQEIPAALKEYLKR